MGKFLKISRRIIAAVMIAVTLSCTVVGDVLQVQQAKEVYAAAEFTALHALIESIMAAMGLTFSSRADLNNAAAGLNEQMASSKSTVFTELSDLLKSYASTGSGKMYLSKKLYQTLYVYLYNQASGKISSASDVKENVNNNSTAFDDVSVVSFNRVNMSKMTLNDFLPDDGSFVGSENISKLFYMTTIVAVRTFFAGSQKQVYLYTTYASGFSYKTTDTYYYMDFLALNSATGKLIHPCNIVSFYLDESAGGWKKGSRGHLQDGYLYADSFSEDGVLINKSSLSSNKYDVYVDSSVSKYDDSESFVLLNSSKTYAPTKPVYGSTSAAKTYDEDETAGTVSVPISPDSITEKVEEAVTDAMTKNPSITEEQLNDAVTKVLDSNAEISGDITEGTATVAGLLTSILKAVQGVAKDVTKIKQNTSITDGSSALDLSDVTDAFTVIEGSAGDNKDDDDKPPDEPELWRWTPVGFEFLKFLKPLFQFFAEPLSIITNSLRLIWTSIEAVPGNISSELQKWINPALSNLCDGIGDICDDIVALPDQIGKAIGAIKIEVPEINVPEIAVPDVKVEVPDVNVNFPEIPNYTNLLQQIIDLLSSFFVIDADAINVSVSALKQVWSDKLPFIGQLHSLFDAFKFKDSYDYPVIEIKTPNVLKDFYTSDTIVLLDFAEYSKYIFWARSLLRAMLWLAFGLSVFKHFRTSLHVG